MKQSLAIIIAIALAVSGCNKYLDVKPKGIVIPENLNDYEAILNSQILNLTFPPALLYCTDEYYDEFDDINVTTAANAYYWRPGLDPSEKENPAVWGDLYKAIYHTNVIINNIGDVKDGTPAKINQIRAEALLIRAECYYYLLGIFARAYNTATAATDPGLPLVRSTNVTDKVPQRASVQEVLDTILNNIHDAIPHLPRHNINKYRATVYGAYGMLSRIYLYMGDYIRSAEFAEKALEAQHSWLRFYDYADVFEMPDTEISPEVIWMRAGSDYSVPTFMLLSDELRALYQPNDLRFEMLTGTNNKGLYWGGLIGSANFGITIAELYLNQAEALARAGDYTAAMDTLNKIRINRFAPGEYQPLTASSKEEALDIVLEERRRELAFLGLRWFDMKRLDREGRMPLVVRKDRTTLEIKARLEPGSKNYVFQIPARVQQFNPDMILNDR